MPLIERRKPRTPLPSLAPSTKPPPAPSETGSGRSLSQTRLDRICRPTGVYHRAFFRWFLRLSQDPERYPAAEMKRYLEEDLGPQLSRLRVQVAQPPEEMTGKQWETLEDALQLLQAKADAITRVLETRTAKGPTCRPRSMLTKPLAASSGSETPPTEFDPFRDE